MGLSTINRELANQLAKFPEVKITFFLPKCSQEDRKIALEHKAKIVQATPLPDFAFCRKICKSTLSTVKRANGFKWYTQTLRNLECLKAQFQRLKKSTRPK